MKPVTLFYQPRCPFCKKALGYLEELQRQEPYSRIEIRMIDELSTPITTSASFFNCTVRIPVPQPKSRIL